MFAVGLIAPLWIDAARAEVSDGPVKVFTLAGQSNMQGKARMRVDDVAECKGNAAFAPTAVRWDTQIEQMYEDTKKTRNALRSGKMTEAEAQAIHDRFAKHGSDKGYHDLGSPKIFCDMGRAFADAMIGLLRQQSH